MKTINLSQLCKNYLEIRKNSRDIKFREYSLIPAEKYFHESQENQLKKILKNKNLIERYIIKLKYTLFRIKPEYFIKFLKYDDFKKSLTTQGFLFFEKSKDKFLNSFFENKNISNGIIKNINTFGKYCEKALSPYHVDKKLRFFQKIGKTIKVIGEPDYVDDKVCYEFKAITYKDRLQDAFRLAYCQVNLGLIFSKPAYNQDHTLNFYNVKELNKNKKIIIDIYFWLEDLIYHFELEPDFELALKIYNYGKD
jgi:hypothetical protein